MRAILCLGLLVASVTAQEEAGDTGSAPFFAEVSGPRVRVRGNAGDVHVILDELEAGTPVKVLGREGDWYRVEIPGGLNVYCARRQGEREYVKLQAPGKGLVVVNDLMIRGTPSTEYLPLGRLSAGERVVVLEEVGDWLKLLAPDRVDGYMHADYVTRSEDQEAAGKSFRERHRSARRAMLEAGTASKSLVKAEKAEAARRAAARSAFKAYEDEQEKALGQRDPEGLRSELQEVREAAPEGHPDRARAEALLATLEEWEQLQAAWEELKKHREEVQAETSKRYGEELAALRRHLDAEAKRRREEAQGPYVANGWVREADPVSGMVYQGQRFALYRDSRQREYILRSDRYDLSDYSGMLVGILEAGPPREMADAPVPMLEVKRLEILRVRQR